MELLGLFVFFVFCVGIYLFPSVVALIRKKANAPAIFVLNIFLGWTFAGWLIALVWACCKDPSINVHVHPRKQ